MSKKLTILVFLLPSLLCADPTLTISPKRDVLGCNQEYTYTAALSESLGPGRYEWCLWDQETSTFLGYIINSSDSSQYDQLLSGPNLTEVKVCPYMGSSDVDSAFVFCAFYPNDPQEPWVSDSDIVTIAQSDISTPDPPVYDNPNEEYPGHDFEIPGVPDQYSYFPFTVHTHPDLASCGADGSITLNKSGNNAAIEVLTKQAGWQPAILGQPFGYAYLAANLELPVQLRIRSQQGNGSSTPRDFTVTQTFQYKAISHTDTMKLTLYNGKYQEDQGQAYGYDDWTCEKIPWLFQSPIKSVKLGASDSIIFQSLAPALAPYFEHIPLNPNNVIASSSGSIITLFGQTQYGSTIEAKLEGRTKAASIDCLVYQERPTIVYGVFVVKGASIPSGASIQQLDSYLNSQVFNQAVINFQGVYGGYLDFDWWNTDSDQFVDFGAANREIDAIDDYAMTFHPEFSQADIRFYLIPNMLHDEGQDSGPEDDITAVGLRSGNKAFVNSGTTSPPLPFVIAHEFAHVIGNLDDIDEDEVEPGIDPDNLMSYLNDTGIERRLRVGQWNALNPQW